MSRIIHLENPSILKILIQTVFFCLVISLSAQIVHAQTPPLDESLEEEAQAIDRMIMCPVCPAETIDQAQVEISFQMRAVIREMLAEGRTREEILDYFVDRYGPDILAAPPKSGTNLLAWILPIVGVAAGLGALFLVIRAMTGRNEVPSPSGGGLGWGRSRNHANEPAGEPPSPEPVEAPPDDPELSSYLEIVDRRLAARRGIRPPPGERPHPNPPPEGEGTNIVECPTPLDSRLIGNDSDVEGTDG